MDEQELNKKLAELWEKYKDSGQGVQIFLRQCDGRGWTKNGWLCSLKCGSEVVNIEGEKTPIMALRLAIEKFVNEQRN